MEMVWLSERRLRSRPDTQPSQLRTAQPQGPRAEPWNPRGSQVPLGACRLWPPKQGLGDQRTKRASSPRLPR